MGQSICILGQHELDYPRNRTLKKALSALNYHIYECHSRVAFPNRQWQLVKQFWKIRKNFDKIWITEGGHRFVLIFKILSFFTGHKIIFDPFTSRYNTRIEDRKLHSKKSFQALVCLWQDWSSCKSADVLVFDTMEHKEYFYQKYSLKQDYFVLPVLIPEENFTPKFEENETYRFEKNSHFKVLFYGTYIPLQGIETIVEAASILKDDPIDFYLIGGGQTFTNIQLMIQNLNLKNIRQIDSVKEVELASYIESSDLCLGIFGDTSKAAQVVPNKVVQCAAMAKPMITRESASIKRHFTHGKSIIECPAANPTALAQAISEIRLDIKLQSQLGIEAREVFIENFSTDAALNILTKNLS